MTVTEALGHTWCSEILNLQVWLPPDGAENEAGGAGCAWGGRGWRGEPRGPCGSRWGWQGRGRHVRGHEPRVYDGWCGAGGDMGTGAKPALPTAAFPSSSTTPLKADPLLGFALPHGLLGFGISLSHYSPSKSRQSWWGESRFSHRLPESQPGQGTQLPPRPESTPLQGPGSSQNPFPKGKGSPLLSEPLRGGHCKHVLSKAFACSGFSLARSPFVRSI